MKKLIPMIAAVAFCSVSVLSNAGGHESKGYSTDNFYIFGSIGQSDIDSGLEGDADISLDETSTMYTLGLGYAINDNFSVEGGYADLGELGFAGDTGGSTPALGNDISFNGTFDTEIDGFFAALKGEIDITPRISAFAKAGFIAWDAEATFSGTATLNGQSFTGSGGGKLDSGTDPFLGLGVAYAFNDSLSVDLQLSRYMLDIGGDVDIDTISVGVAYSF